MTFKARTAAALATLVLTALPLALVPAVAEQPFTASAGRAQVSIEQGQLLGFEDRGIFTYRGVPYAKAERFKAPVAPDNWEGVRLAMNYGENCPAPPMGAVANDEQFNPHRYMPESEACQFVNIWTPATDVAAKKPVMIWIHGGGFTNGSATEQVAYDGRNLSEKGDVVVVSLNHRVNVLGTLDLSGFSDDYADSANTGMEDIVAALEWVKANIDQFGGDPNNVTVFGQSGGGSKIRILMGIPAAKGLFHKAILESGSGLDSPAIGGDVAQAIAAHTVENLGLTKETIGKIAEVSYPDLLAATQKAITQTKSDGMASAAFRPSVDGRFIPEEPVDIGWAKYSSDIPLMVGNVLNEYETVINNSPAALLADNKALWTPERTAEKMSERFGDKAEAIGAAWATAFPDFTPQDAFFFDPTRRQGVMKHAQLKAETGTAPVYVWQFTWQSPVLDGVAGNWHCSEIPFVFDNVELVPQSNGGGDDVKALAHVMSSAWINFARTGNPNHNAMPQWPAYTPENGATMLFNNTSDVRFNHDQALLKIFYPE